MTTNTDIAQLKFNKMSSAKYEELKEAGQLVENEFYITPDGGAIPEFNTETSQQILSNDGTNLIWREEQIGYNQVTNCITEIPQDIKVELNSDNTITLKAGSKLYIPNGFETDGTTKKFDIKIIENDISFNASTYASNQHMACLLPTNLIQTLVISTQQFSGDTAPTVTATYAFWYDTANNIIKYTIDNGANWQNGCSLPFSLLNITNGTGIISIDQIFNGLGFIGSTIFALPGVKGLIPNNRNSDGSLNNIETITTNVLIYNETIERNGYIFIQQSNSLLFRPIFTIKTKEEVFGNGNYFVLNDNKMFYYNGTTWDNQQRYICGTAISNNLGKIISFNPYNTNQLLDKNDTTFIAEQAMPSSKYVDLELGVSGTTYTALANGYIQFVKQATASGQYMVAYDNDLPSTSVDENTIAIKWSTSGVNDVLYFPVRKGQKFTIGYTFDGPTVAFRIIFAQGDS